MAEILNRLFKYQSLPTLNYRIHRFCNYIVLNFSKNCKYLYEIGINIQKKKISLTVRTDLLNKEVFENEWKEFLQYDSFKREYAFLKANGMSFEIEVVGHPFANIFIKRLSHYYFVPEKSKNRYIFKYCSFNKNTISLLINNSLWFSDPSTFNDPFDCRYAIDADPTEDEMIKFYYNESKLLNPRLDYPSFVNKFKIPFKKQFLQDLEEHHFNNSIKKQGVCCFTERYDNKLMWAHYAENVTGLCLIFDPLVDVDSDFYVFSRDKVRYRNGVIRKFYDATGFFEVTDVLYTKNITWKYEQEIRERTTFEKSTKNRSKPFDPKSLVGIILGAKMLDSDKETIKNLVLQLNKYNIDIIDSYVDLANNRIRLKKNRLKLR